MKREEQIKKQQEQEKALRREKYPTNFYSIMSLGIFTPPYRKNLQVKEINQNILAKVKEINQNILAKEGKLKRCWSRIK